MSAAENIEQGLVEAVRRRVGLPAAAPRGITTLDAEIERWRTSPPENAGMNPVRAFGWGRRPMASARHAALVRLRIDAAYAAWRARQDRDPADPTGA